MRNSSRAGCGRVLRGLRLPVLLFGLLLSSAPAAAPDPSGEGEALAAGAFRQSRIAAGESQVWRIAVAQVPVALAVEPQGADLALEHRGPDGAVQAADTPGGRWAAVVLLLAEPGEHRIAVHTTEPTLAAQPYTVRVLALPDGADRERWRAAFAAMDRGCRRPIEENPATALVDWRAALGGWRALGERRWEAEVLEASAELELIAGDLPAAAAHAREAGELWRALAVPPREASAANLLGRVLVAAGDITAARAALASALTVWQRLGSRPDEVETHANICYLEQTGGSLAAALACQQDLAFYRELGDRTREAALLNNLGGVAQQMGEPEVALANHRQALNLRRALGDLPGEVQSLTNLAVLHRSLGEWQEALRLYGEAREIAARLGDPLQQAALLNNLGFLYDDLGEPRRALVLLGEALELRHTAGDRRGESITRNNLGLAWRHLGDLECALDQHRQALALARAAGDPRQEAATRLRLGEVLLERSDAAGALAELAPALAGLAQLGNRQGEARALLLRGRALALGGRPEEALPVLAEALGRSGALRDRGGEAEALEALAGAERTLGHGREALAHAEAAVAKVEELRSGVASPLLRATFLATRRRAYGRLIDLWMDRHAAEPGAGFDRTALEVSERARARGLLDLLSAGGAEGPAHTVPAGLLERRRSLRRRLSAKAFRHLVAETSSERVADLGRELEALRAELDGVEAQIERDDPRAAALRNPPLVSAAEMAGLLDPGTLLLEVALGEERSVIWAVGPERVESAILPAGMRIEELARRALAELGTAGAGPAGAIGRSAAAELSRVLLGPLWPAIARAERLAVVPDAALCAIPFGALPVPIGGAGWEADRAPLLERLEVVALPSAASLAVLRRRLAGRPPAAERAAVLADPVFAADDPRLRPARLPAGPSRGPGAESAWPAFERLPATRQEAAAIVRLAPAGEVWTALDLAANRETVLAERMRAARVIHFATHGLADPHRPELSGLVLSLVDGEGRPRDGFLGLADLADLDLAADLVVLSGCRTALGAQVRGEGLIGLARAFQQAGVPRVVASHWAVQDRATAELMTRFYRGLWQDGLRPAAALRAAQRALRRDPRYRSPSSWAGFTLHGDWR
jgi:CHAT domain-containing protein/tetratricopeptide (TPR) repeat protein